MQYLKPAGKIRILPKQISMFYKMCSRQHHWYLSHRGTSLLENSHRFQKRNKQRLHGSFQMNYEHKER